MTRRPAMTLAAAVRLNFGRFKMQAGDRFILARSPMPGAWSCGCCDSFHPLPRILAGGYCLACAARNWAATLGADLAAENAAAADFLAAFPEPVKLTPAALAAHARAVAARLNLSEVSQ